MHTTRSFHLRVATSVCIVLFATVAAAGTFHWNWRKAEELDWKQSLGKVNLKAANRAALQIAIAERLRPGMADLEIGSEEELKKVALDTRIKLIDLNADGIPEVVAQGCCLKAGCGATGNCPFWVFRKSASHYGLLLETFGQVFTIESTKTNGFSDIVVGTHDSARQKTLTIYHYRNGGYKDVGCYVADWWSSEGGTFHELKEPEITPCAKQ